MRITISGLPGSGTSTVSKILSKKLNYPYIYAGNIFRQMAVEKGKSLLEFNKLAEGDNSIDNELDDKMVKYARDNEDIILEGRIIAWMVKKEKLDAYKIWIGASLDVRVERVAKRDKQDQGLAKRDVAKREEIEVQRYIDIYNIDIKDLSVYDLKVDSSTKTPNEIVSFILEKINSHKEK